MATATQEAYCVKCRQKRPMKDAQEVTMKHVRGLDGLLCLTYVFHRAGLCHQSRPFVVPFSPL